MSCVATGEVNPSEIRFVRQGVQRFVFDSEQSIPLAKLDPATAIGLSAMHPTRQYLKEESSISLVDGKLVVESEKETRAGIWFGGFNPFATYTIDLETCSGRGMYGFEFSNPERTERLTVAVEFNDRALVDVRQTVVRESLVVSEGSIAVGLEESARIGERIIVQMLGSGLTVYMQNGGVPSVVGQSEFNRFLDLRRKEYIQSFQSNFYANLEGGRVQVRRVEAALTAGVGLADIRAITYEDGEPLLDRERLWYTMSIRGRALPHHIQGVFSMNPTAFDLRLEGIIVFDRGDGLLRNEIASHIFFDRNDGVWRGLTTGFSAFARPDRERKQLLAVESRKDPRFGYSVMDATPFDMVGDIEDPHLLFDEGSEIWRMFTCENTGAGYKGVLFESDHWDRGYTRIAGPLERNSTGTSMQRIGNRIYCFSGSSDREIFIYTYPDLEEAGTLRMDLPPWDEQSGTRVWPNVVQLPETYPVRYVALMMDRFNFPGLVGPNWSYGAVYWYYGYE